MENKKKRHLCVIPARGGSKGIHKKNIANINGSSLISYTIKQAIESKVFDYIHVSTDCEEIKEEALLNGANCEFLRPNNFASDQIGTAPSILNSIEELSKRALDFDFVYELQPTYLFRSVQTIRNIKKLINKNESICTVVKIENTSHPDFICSLSDSGHLKFGVKKPDNFARQEISERYAVIGVVLASSVSFFKKYNSFYHQNTFPYVLNKKIEQFDINDKFDMEIAKYLLKL